MAVYDIPLPVRFRMSLKEAREHAGFTPVDGDSREIEMKMVLSVRMHRHIASLYPTTGDFLYPPAGFAYSTITKGEVANLHDWLGNTNTNACIVPGDEYGSVTRSILARVYYSAENAKGSRVRYHVDLPEDDLWKLREGLRLVDGTYKPTPMEWEMELGSLFKDSVLDPYGANFVYPHVSTNSEGMIAFTENSKKGQVDIQKRMKPGKFLKEFFGHGLSTLHGENAANGLIAKMAAMFGNHVKSEELKFAASPNEIAWVYTHGPSSCMSHPTENFDTREWGHPTSVLGAGDLQVAYIQRGNRVTARALVWPEKKKWTRIYGDGERLRPLLKKEGYSEGGSHCFDGAKLLIEECGERWDGGFVMPYIDNHSWARKDGDHFVLDNSKGYIYVQNTCGTAEPGAICKVCSNMGRRQNFLNYRESPRSPQVLACQDCWEKNTWQCFGSGDRFGHDYPKVTMADGTFVSEGWFRQYGFTCSYDKQNYPVNGRYWNQDGPCHDRDTTDSRIRMWDGTLWHHRNFAKHGKTYEGKRYSLAAYERQILKDMGQSDLPLAEAAYAKVLEERLIKAAEERKKYLEQLEKERLARAEAERVKKNERRRMLRAFHKDMKLKGITVSKSYSANTPYYRYIEEVNAYYYVPENYLERARAR